MSKIDQVRTETVAFLRGNYRLDEVPGKFYGIPCVKFRQGKKTIVSVNIHEDALEFLIILGKAEREKFEAERHTFPQEINDLYENTKTYHDGKWLLIRAESPEALEPVKRLILIKKKPNRKPFSGDKAVYGKCGHRCDLCIHFAGLADDFRAMLLPHLNAVYGSDSDWSMRCTGCSTEGCYCASEPCDALKCQSAHNLPDCPSCEDFPCDKSTVGYNKLEHRALSADDVTWAILPYAPYRYKKNPHG